MTNAVKCVKIFHIMDYALVGNHPAIQKIRELIGLVSDTGFSVLLLGETGTGKEVVARLLHGASKRNTHRFIKVNCAALPFNLLESELFGYEKGAFTGADKFKPGKFELASEGVIFLDEVGDMPLLLQAKLLEVLQSNEFARLGGTDVVKVRTWILASTNHDLEKDMKEGRFREDLYYRLNVIRIDLPPLRERKDDIPLLLEYFIDKYSRELNMERRLAVSPELTAFFVDYPWPGNIRQMASTLLRLMIGDSHSEVRHELLRAINLEEPDETDREIPMLSGLPSRNAGKISGVPLLKEVKARAAEEIERRVILDALTSAGWNKREASRMLKISYKALFNKLNSLGLGRDR